MMKVLLACVLLTGSLLRASGQTASSAPAATTTTTGTATATTTDSAPTSESTMPVVTFTLDFPKSEPEHCVIRVPQEGIAHYESSGRLEIDSELTDSFEFNFAISPAMRSRIFDLTGKAGYFQGGLEGHDKVKHVAFTGKKTLTYKDASRSGEGSYNYSSNAAVQDLTSIFEGLSVTLEFGHRLDYDRRYQKLAMEDELKRMEEMEERNVLVEVGVIQPILEQIAADSSVMNVARARAQRLLASQKK
jgi:hypothetical protein